MSSAASRLAEIASRQRALAAEQARLAEEATALLAQLAGDRAPIDAPGANKLIDTAVASKITRRSSSWLYSIARKHPSLGWKVAGSWVFSEPMLRAFMAGRAAQCEESEICEVCDAPGIQHTPNQAHISGTDAGTRT